MIIHIYIYLNIYCKERTNSKITINEITHHVYCSETSTSNKQTNKLVVSYLCADNILLIIKYNKQCFE